MEVLFDGAHLAETFRNARKLRREHGEERAKKIQRRLKQLEAAETLIALRTAAGHCHELRGDLAGLLSLDLDGPYRLLFRPADAPAPGRSGGLDWSAVRAVIVIGIADTHK